MLMRISQRRFTCMALQLKPYISWPIGRVSGVLTLDLDDDGSRLYFEHSQRFPFRLSTPHTTTTTCNEF